MLRISLFILFLGIFGLDLYAQGNSPTITQKNGKYGLVDENGNVLVENECDTIYTNSGNYKNEQDIFGTICPFFILKKSSKYAYAYNSSKDYIIHEPLPDNQWHWVVSNFIYDDLQQYRFDKDFYIFAVKYRIKNKWGILYSYYTRVRDSKLYFGLSYLPSGFAKLQQTKAVYDTIGERYEDGLYNIKLNGKYGLIYLSPPNEHVDLGGDFDTIPWLLSENRYIYSASESKVGYFRQVKKNGKWGIVKLNVEKKELEYIIPCDFDDIKYTFYADNVYDQEYNFYNDNKIPLFICKKTTQQKAVIYDDKGKSVLEVKNFDRPVYEFFIFHIDTIPNDKEEIHKKMAQISLGTFNMSLKVMENNGFCLVDLQSGKATFYIDDSNTTYRTIIGHHGIIIEKQTKTEMGIAYEYIDYETGIQKLIILPKKGISYFSRGTLYDKNSFDYAVVFVTKGDSKKKYYYDFRKKKFFKGNCKECQ